MFLGWFQRSMKNQRVLDDRNWHNYSHQVKQATSFTGLWLGVWMSGQLAL